MSGKVFLQFVDTINQWFGELKQDFTFRRQFQVGTASFEQDDFHFAFQGLDLQRN
jgi:hypothetical protein